MTPTVAAATHGGLFHTFQGITQRKSSTASDDSVRTRSQATAKRITTPHACAECKRRKIRCDGQQPCGQCLSSRAPKRCFYDKHRQRVVPSRKTLEALSQSLEECRSVLKRLFPDHELQTLLPLSHQELVGLLGGRVTGTAAVAGLPSPPLQTSPIPDKQSRATIKPATREQMPCRDAVWDEERLVRGPVQAEVDDVSALSLSADRQSSYLGASSIKAALMVMLKVQPELRNSLAAPLNSAEMTHNFPVGHFKAAAGLHKEDPQRIPWSWKGQTLIDAYFKRFHIFAPMLDETTFRADYLEGQRFDSPWLALLNMVFAMGSIAAMKSDDRNHINYYDRAMEHLPLDAFGSSHVETVQALALVGGFYLHYVNRPHTANAVLGAAIRMASVLGLHRESLVLGGSSGQTSDGAAVETRRRTWWSLFCLDTWATTTTGRPSFGRWGPAMNLRPPELGLHGGRDSSQQAGALPLIENIKFCKMATQIQDMLAVSPLLSRHDRRAADGQLVGWYSDLPWLLRTTDPCAEPLYIARCIMKWRYQNLRMLLHRPVLLSLASSGLHPHTQACDSDLAAIDTCRELAAQTIDDIAREWTRNQMSGWNAVWFLYQAAMVPLVSIFWQQGSSHVPEWLKQVETVLDLLDAMEDWSLAAKRSREVVWRIYEATCAVNAQAEAHRPRAAASPAAPSQSSHLASPRHHLGASLSVPSHLINGNDKHLLMSPDAELHVSPVGLEPAEGLDMLGTIMDLDGLWDADATYLSGGVADVADVADVAGPFGAPQILMPLDYAMMGLGGTIDAFSYVH